MAPATYGQTWWRDGYACGCMILSIEDVIEPRLRAAGHLGPDERVDAYQQAYSSGVPASAGTHGGGGALDHRKASDGETIIWRECGVADWQRGTPEDDAFDDHNHGIWQGCPHLSDDAAGQLDQYEAGCDGLAGWGPDQSPDVAPITWQAAYDKYADPTPPEPEGLLGMTHIVGMRRGNDWTIPAQTDGWDVALPLNDDGASTACQDTDDGLVIMTACLTVSGLKDGEAFDLAWAIVDTNYEGGDAKWPGGWATRRDARRAVAGDAGYRTVEATFAGKLGKAGAGRSKRLRLVYQTASKTAKLGSLTVEGGY
jgi:hypothetical protein